jgi:nicotinamide phosphoribosyltransferase
VIQGDGINFEVVEKIFAAVHKEKFSAASVTFGMGGGLLQRVDRDTMSFATKLSHVEDPDGTKRDVMKRPKTDSGKISFPGVLSVRRNEQGIPTVYPAANSDTRQAHLPKGELLEVVYDHGPVRGHTWPTFAEIRKRVQDEWTRLPCVHDPVSVELRAKVQTWLTQHHIPQ